ncbi:hypothetical protein KZ810_07200 [Sphingomonas sp. RHCKR47]|uniref:hypothetical protein n=1 Tax=Sphingomonas citricola TaxID=2862498 RepID=UPI001CA544C1|nr:hypothetical protein [Sphingomonas citricola]MBW6523284.1 hypothetical protein [Sphingomonas citricola]
MATETSTIETAATAVPATPGVGQLSFTGRRPDDSGVDLWAPADVGGGWAAECDAGREYGREAVDYIRSSGDAAALGGIVRTIAERGTFGGVEAGFFAALSMSLAEPA